MDTTMKIVLAVVIGAILGAGGVMVLAKPQATKPVADSGTPAPMQGATPDAMVQALKAETGSARDEAFLENMIVHHQSAIDMSEVLLESTKRPELQQLAKDIISAQTKEIEMMQNWLKTWYGR